mmetsp:Transcript_16721/g.54439  ORF Transcript_16721/g.54439 Transcript_16721/m.54439 type:complete len:356 (+) Transcript_16721:114-1181(+)
MFDPGASAQNKQQLSRRIQGWVNEVFPASIKASLQRDPSHVMLNVREVACGDPTCSPIDTVIAFIFRNSRQAMTGIPAEMKDVGKKDVEQAMRTMEEELLACEENRDFHHPGQLPPVSPAGEAALRRIAATLRRELVALTPSDVAGVCAATIDMLEQIEEDTAVQQPMPGGQQGGGQPFSSSGGGGGAPVPPFGPGGGMTVETAPPPMVPPSQDPSSRILSASQKNDVNAVGRCVADGISPSYANSLGQTSLHIAAMWGNVDVCRFLVANGAHVDAINHLSNSTPLHVAASSNKDPTGRLTCAKILIHAGANAAVPDVDRFLPFQRVKGDDHVSNELRDLLRNAATRPHANTTTA